MSTHHRTLAVAQATADISVALDGLQREHGLTEVEMLQAVLTWQDRKMKDMLRAERHQDGPGGGHHG